MTEVAIHSPFIKLDAFLKFSMAVETGGEAKLAVQGGEVTVNGTVCQMRGKKLYPGDEVGIDGETYKVTGA